MPPKKVYPRKSYKAGKNAQSDLFDGYDDPMKFVHFG